MAESSLILLGEYRQISSTFTLLVGTIIPVFQAVIFCRAADEASIAAGGIFNADFINLLKNLNPKVIRQMGETLHYGNEILTNPRYEYRTR